MWAAALFFSCNKNSTNPDASGTFEAIETIISAEATGIIQTFTIEEGKLLHVGELVGTIDSTQLYLKKKQLLSQVHAVLSRRPNVGTQLAALNEQLKQAEHEQKRLTKLVASDAATSKQLDDAVAQVEILRKQLLAVESSLGISSSSIGEESKPLLVQVEQLNDQLSKCRLINPLEGTVLVKYAQASEMAVSGKALYKIADLRTLIFRVYVTGDQFARLQLGQALAIHVDDGKGALKSYSGTVTWISNKAEFTPKTIQTKDERANLVYAVKIQVKNDGFLKIGMYGEVSL